MSRPRSRHQRRNADVGDLGERAAVRWLRERGHRVGRVPDSQTAAPALDHVDGVWIDAVVTPHAGPVFAAGQPWDAKAVAYRQTDGDGQRRGRVHIRKRAHDHLLDVGGEYVIVVYDETSLVYAHGDVQAMDVLAVRVVSARTLDAYIKTWTRDPGTMDEIGRVSWAALCDPDLVDPSDPVLREVTHRAQ